MKPSWPARRVGDWLHIVCISRSGYVGMSNTDVESLTPGSLAIYWLYIYNSYYGLINCLFGSFSTSVGVTASLSRKAMGFLTSGRVAFSHFTHVKYIRSL